MKFDSLKASLADRYLVERELGAGGMATVYLALDLKHDRKVAIKVLRPELAAVIGAERFLAEIKTTANLQHPHILALFDSGEVTTGHPEQGDGSRTVFYVMPYVEGESLRDRLQRERQLPVADAVRIATEVASALDYAHRHGVIHRDIKPENIMLHDGQALVADFGIALAVSRSDGGTRLTETGMSLGTPHYMSPEQAMGEREITARTDIYALGCVTYEMLVGEPPFSGPTAQAIIARVMTEEPRALTIQRKSVPPGVEAAVFTALEKLPADRFDSAKAFAEALTNPHFTTATAAAGPGRDGRNLRNFRSWVRSPWYWAAVLALVAGVTIAMRMVSQREISSLPVATFTPWTFESQSIFIARFTPDGQTMVYDAMPAVGQTPRLFVIRADHPDPVTVGPDSTHLLSVSPSGKLAILTHAKYLAHRLFLGTLSTMSLGGEAPHELVAGVREADWAPDDTSMAVVRDSSGSDLLEYPVKTVLVRSAGYLSDPSVSPSGDAVAYFEHPGKYDDRGSAVIVNRSGDIVARSPEAWGLEGIAWQADGSGIFYSGAGTELGSQYQVRALSRSGRDRLVLSGAGNLIVQDVSQGGRLLVTQDQTPFVLVGKGRNAPTETTLGVRDLSTVGTMSRDGQYLAFADEGAFGGPNYTVLWRKTDGSPPVPLGEGEPAAISDDNALVLALVFSTPPRLMLYPTGPGTAQRLDSGQFQSLQYAGGIRVAGRDTTIFFCGAEPKQAGRCYIKKLPAGSITPITPPGANRGWLSPDGDRVLALGDSFSIYSTDGGPSQPALGFRPDDVPIRWSPDGHDVWVWANPYAISPLHVDRVNPVTGARASLVDIVPRDLTDVRAVAFPTLADDPHSYAFDEYPYMSRLFTVDGVR